jgi:two-component system OmpR family sensor kinase
MSLRARLLLAVLSLAGAGLLIAGVVTYTLLDSFLLNRVDQQLRQAADPTAHILADMLNGRSAGPPPGSGGRPGPMPPGTYAALLDQQGQVLVGQSFGFTSQQQADKPALPASLPSPRGRAPAFLDLSGTDSTVRYRAAIAPAEGAPSYNVLVAVPLTEVRSTLQRLLLVELGVGAGVLALLGIVGAWAVRLGLQPLEDIAEVAGQIAAGDLQRRVSPAEPRTEIGRLGLALNAMLSKIEEAFAARRASEDRLRQFVADASHELRTPVASIRGYAELFRRGAALKPDDLSMAMRRIEDEAGRMGHLVDDLLLLARLDEGRPLERQPVDLSQLALDAAADARATDPRRSIQTSIAEETIVIGDEMRLRQVVANLVRNALEHTPAGKPIDIATQLAGSCAELVVADHGPGIPPELAARVFERFYRADPARGHATGSSGLGLAIVAAIVAAHGGSVRVSDTPGGGATFTVTLPLYSAEGEQGHPSLPAREPAGVQL